MISNTPKSLSWPEVLAALRACTAESVMIRDGKITAPADAVRTRPSSKGTELCLFPGDSAARRSDLIERLEALSKASGRRFMSSARANVNETYLLVEDVSDESIDGTLVAVINTRRPKLGFNQSQQTGHTTTFRNKRIKTT